MRGQASSPRSLTSSASTPRAGSPRPRVATPRMSARNRRCRTPPSTSFTNSCARGALAAPAQGARLDRIVERPGFGAGMAVFLLQPVIPARLGVGIVDQRQYRPIAQPLLLHLHDVAVLAQKGPHIGAQ